MERDLDTSEDTPLWVFSLEEEGQDGVTRMVDFGMGGLVLESTIEPLLASRETGSVKLSERSSHSVAKSIFRKPISYVQSSLHTTASLFITPTYQNLGLGKLCLDLLENLAIDQFNAKWLTLDTRVHGPIDGLVEGRDDEKTESSTLRWYKRRGYEEFLVCRAVVLMKLRL
jgi:GNAT superfamily N-acetyltransferase